MCGRLIRVVRLILLIGLMCRCRFRVLDLIREVRLFGFGSYDSWGLMDAYVVSVPDYL